jgi:hypothetical protein
MCRTLHWKELTGINLRTFVRLFALLFPIAYCNPSNTKKFESRESQKCTSSTGSANFLFNELTPIHTVSLLLTGRLFALSSQHRQWRAIVSHTISLWLIELKSQAESRKPTVQLKSSTPRYKYGTIMWTDLENLISELKKDPGIPRLPDLKIRVRNRGKQWAHPVRPVPTMRSNRLIIGTQSNSPR